MSKHYKESPLIEALCEFQFIPGQDWDLIIPGLIHERIKNDYPVRRPFQQFETELVSTDKGIENRIKTIERIQFLRKDERVMVQIGVNQLVINHLKPYSGWKAFLPIIEANFKMFSEIVKPKAFSRIGLRYINRIDFPVGTVDIKKYFEFRPSLGPKMPKIFGQFILGVYYPFEENRDLLRVQLGSGPPSGSNQASFLLDLDYFTHQPEVVNFQDTISWIISAHERIEETFEATITEESRIKFGVEQDAKL